MRTSKEETDRLMIVEEQEHQREAEHANNLGSNADIIDNRDEPDADHIDQCTYDNRDQGNKDSVWHAQNRCWDLRKDSSQRDRDGKGHGSDREHASEEVDPASEP